MRAHETEILGVLYDCDPCKNTECEKTSCKLMLKGECCMTTQKEFAKDGCENSPHIFRQPIQGVRILTPNGKPLADVHEYFDGDEDIAYGVPIKEFQKLYSKEELEQLKEKQFRFIIYSPSEYDILGKMSVCFVLETSCPKECFDLDYLSGKTVYKLTRKKQ